MNPTASGGGQLGPLGMLLTPWVKRLMISTAVLSIVSAIALAWMKVQVPLWFALEPQAIWGDGTHLPGIPAIWQLVTHPLFVFDPLGLIFSLALYGWFAGTMEDWWGPRRFLIFLGIIAGGAAVLTTVLALFWDALASSIVSGPFPLLEGLIVAWGLTFPNREIRLFFVLPVKGIHMVWLTLGVLGLYIIFSGAVAPFAPHLLAIALAALIVKGAWRPRRVVLWWRKWRIEQEMRREQAERRRRVEKAEHLRVVDEDDESEEKPPPKKNGSTGPEGGWLH